MEFSKVMLNTEATAGEKLMLLQGWAPASRVGEISEWLDAQHVYYEVTSPVPGDNVPIQLNNKGFFAWFEPICKLYMLPKYNELDLTPFFAPFFMVFFGLCLGRLWLRTVPVSRSNPVPSVCQEHQRCDETCPLIGAGIGGIHFLLRIADRHVLRSEHLRYRPAFLPKDESGLVHGQ